MDKAIEAIRAAHFRVEPEADPATVEREIAWMLQGGSPLTGKRRIHWATLDIGRRLRAVLLVEQGHRCCYCRQPMDEHGPQAARPTFEHVVALGDGGPDHPDNLALACYACNQDRGRAVSTARQAAAAHQGLSP